MCTVRLYKADGSGLSSMIELSEIEEIDVEFFNTHNITVSMETLRTGQYVLYACPNWDVDEEHIVIHIVGDETFREAMHQLRIKSENSHV